jgi:hypothetical protein
MCASCRSKIKFKDLSKALIVIKGGQSSSNQSSGSSASSKGQPTSLRGGTTQKTSQG